DAAAAGVVDGEGLDHHVEAAGDAAARAVGEWGETIVRDGQLVAAYVHGAVVCAVGPAMNHVQVQPEGDGSRRAGVADEVAREDVVGDFGRAAQLRRAARCAV